MKPFPLFILVMLALYRPATAQNRNRPYSVYGIGDLAGASIDRSAGMASTANAYASHLYLVTKNPASVAHLPASQLYFALGSVYESLQFRGDVVNADNSRATEFTVRNLSLYTKPTQNWATGIAFQPYSQTDYQFAGRKSIEGSNEMFDAQYEGEGGIHQVYLHNALKLGKHWSAGLKTGLYFGGINQQETLTQASSQAITSRKRDYYSGFYGEGGLLYQSPLGKKWNLSVGGRFASSSKLARETSINVYEGSTLLEDETVLSRSTFRIPYTIGAGVALRHDGGTEISADHDFSAWTGADHRHAGWSLRNQSRTSLALQRSRYRHYYNQVVETRFFQFGLYHEKQYLSVAGHPLRETGVTAGWGGPLSGPLLYMVGAQFGTRGKTSQSLIRETAFRITLSFQYVNYLFSKGRRYD